MRTIQKTQLLLFQSTLLQEERHEGELHGAEYVGISIHAPTRGATLPGFSTVRILIFQSTLLQEERHPHPLLQPHPYDFNPRSYKRSDLRERA